MAALRVDKKGDELFISIESKRIGLLARSILSVLIIISYLVPFSVFFFIQELEIGITYIFTLIIFWGGGTYFLRLLLWNIYGKEVYIVKRYSLSYYYDYKYFKDNKRSVKSESPIQIGYYSLNDLTSFQPIVRVNSGLNDECYLVFIVNDEIIKSNIQIRTEALKLLR